MRDDFLVFSAFGKRDTAQTLGVCAGETRVWAGIRDRRTDETRHFLEIEILTDATG